MMNVGQELKELTMNHGGDVVIQSIIVNNEVEFHVHVFAKEGKDGSQERLAHARHESLDNAIYNVLKALYSDGSATTLPTIS